MFKHNSNALYSLEKEIFNINSQLLEFKNTGTFTDQKVST
jgi:hypothetical protein